MNLFLVVDYPSNVHNIGWPQKVFIQPNPHQYYYTNEQNSYATNPIVHQILPYTSDLNNNHDDHNYQQPSNSNYALPVAIRRHTPGSTDPPLHELPLRTVSQTPNVLSTIKEIPSQPVCYSAPVRNHPRITESSDPDDRPIKPMKNTSVYNVLPSLEKINQPKKPLSPLKPIQSSPFHTSPSPFKPVQSPLAYKPDSSSSPLPLKPIQSSPIYKPDSFSSPLPLKFIKPSSAYKPGSFPTPLPPVRLKNVSDRRPIQTNIKTLFDIDTPPQYNPHRQIVVNEYDDDADDYPVVYVKPAPKKMISYRQIPTVTTRQTKNYQVPQARRMVRYDSLPGETIIYRTLR